MVSLTDNLSLYSIIGMWVISYYPTYVKSSSLVKAGAFTNVQPRTNTSRLSEKKHVHPDIAARAIRAEGAHYNGLEAFPFFGLAVLAGNYAGIDNYTLNVTCGLYLLSRMLYNYIYLNHTTTSVGHIRTLVWLMGVAGPLYLLGKSASLLSNR